MRRALKARLIAECVHKAKYDSYEAANRRVLEVNARPGEHGVGAYQCSFCV